LRAVDHDFRHPEKDAVAKVVGNEDFGTDSLIGGFLDCSTVMGTFRVAR
jgi:hypothetical protein